MTITQDPSAPLVAVVARRERHRAYRVRAFTRDASKPVAQELEKRRVDVVTVSLVVGNREQVYKVFEGVDYAFLVTNYWEHQSKERVTLNLHASVASPAHRAAKAGGASRIIWSGLPSYEKISGGSIVGAHHFESKALVTDYAGFYGTNLLGVIPSLNSNQTARWVDERFSLALPFIDIADDYGLWARYMLELSEEEFPDGQSVVTHSETITLPEMASQLSEVTRKKVIFKRISFEKFGENMRKAGFPVESMVAVWRGLDRLTVVFRKRRPTAISHTVLPRRTRTWKKFAEMSNWSEILH
ncbi:NmrA domain-containing protein [Favolaschia claudopus]|uniref:NmrA domain-containing protein n=1 Tax=Favolaschia claudopus TaxID=2862362 RepID=A0AAW0BQ25_9AGAR